MSLADTDIAVYFSDHDAVIECGACDPDYGEPEGWPPWTDQRWEPTAADSAWLNTHPLPPIAGGAPESGPSDQDWEDYHRWSAWQDRLEQIYGPHGITDDDIQAAGLPVG
jgi:hypothetical protein